MDQRQQSRNSQQQQQQKRVAVADKFEQLSQVSETTTTSRTTTDAVSLITTTMTSGTGSTTTTTTAMATRFRNSRQFEGNDLNEADEDFISVSSLNLTDKPKPETQQTSTSSAANNDAYDWYPVTTRPKTPQPQSQQNAWSRPLNVPQPVTQKSSGLANDEPENRLKTLGRGRGRGISRF